MSTSLASHTLVGNKVSRRCKGTTALPTVALSVIAPGAAMVEVYAAALTQHVAATQTVVTGAAERLMVG